MIFLAKDLSPFLVSTCYADERLFLLNSHAFHQQLVLKLVCFIGLITKSVNSNDAAPSNDAFDKLPAGTVESLLLPENMDQLVEILLLHVFPGNVHSSSLISGEVIALNGSPLAIDVSSDGVLVNDANVVIPDIIASNGIIHVIDTVLLPPPSVPGSSYCTYSPDMTCYESGWPSCCMEDGGETCAEEQPPCEIDGPTTATDICLTEEDCEESAYDQGKLS
jgi:hypothetical protein